VGFRDIAKRMTQNTTHHVDAESATEVIEDVLGLPKRDAVSVLGELVRDGSILQEFASGRYGFSHVMLFEHFSA
jgi:hypothetical protein